MPFLIVQPYVSLNIVSEHSRMKQLNRLIRCAFQMLLLYQISQSFFDLLVNGATIFREVTTNMLKRVELRLQQGKGNDTLNICCNYNLICMIFNFGLRDFGTPVICTCWSNWFLHVRRMEDLRLTKTDLKLPPSMKTMTWRRKDKTPSVF
jgi:hypothetical protein